MLRSQYRVVGADTVKFARARRGLWPIAIAGCVLLGPGAASADPSNAPLLLGAGDPVPRRVITTDPRLPTGSPFEARDRPAAVTGACSSRLPVCVHGTRGVAGDVVGQALGSFEQAFERLVGALDLPAPLPDDGRGGSDALDLYLLPTDAFTPTFERVYVSSELPRSGSFDAAPAFCTALADAPELLERAATLCLGEAIALRVDSAETPHLRRAFATELWWMSGHPTSFDYEAVDAVQRRPTRALAARDLSALSEGSALLFDYLEHKLGVGEPAQLSLALFAASAQITPASAASWQNEPDLFDVLRHTLGESELALARLLGDFAVTRAFLGDREDGLHLPTLAWSGRFGAPIFDWVIPFASLPRRVRVTPPEPTGAVLVWLDLRDAPKGVPLGFQAEWEPPAQFQWLLVRVGADGTELGRLEVPYQQRETRVEARLVDLGGAAALIAVGAHIERVDVEQPFDPDVAPFEPHGALVYFVEL
jgi:hypothetical protein